MSRGGSHSGRGGNMGGGMRGGHRGGMQNMGGGMRGGHGGIGGERGWMRGAHIGGAHPGVGPGPHIGPVTLAHGYHHGGPRNAQYRSWFNRPGGYWAGYGGYYWPWPGVTYNVYNDDCTQHTLQGRVTTVVKYSRYPDVFTLRLADIDELFWFNGNLEYLQGGDRVIITFSDCGNSTQRWITNIARL